MTVGEKLRALILKNKYSQKDIAINTGIPASTISSAMQKNTVSVVMLEKICDYMKLDICSFFNNEKTYEKEEDNNNTVNESQSFYGLKKAIEVLEGRLNDKDVIIEGKNKEIANLEKELKEKKSVKNKSPGKLQGVRK